MPARPATDSTVVNVSPISALANETVNQETILFDPMFADDVNNDTINDSVRYQYFIIPDGYFSPVVFDKYEIIEPLTLHDVPLLTDDDPYAWLKALDYNQRLINQARHYYVINNPRNIKYFRATLPVPPRNYRAHIDPTTTKIILEETKVNSKAISSELNPDIEYKHWIHNFDASLQFSQAYISPNWYQGGNKNLNMIGHLIYNVKLNPKFYPNILFDATLQYKLSLNNAPDDSIHSVNITEDLLQFNATFGYKAAKRWYYSANLMFKTQLLRSYATNSHDLKTAFLSPGELNLGLGMTYNYSNPKKTLTFDASIAPLSWNLKTCISPDLDQTAYGIEPGHKTVNSIGSSAELKLYWKLAYNIFYTSRLFAFTDYNYLQADWEHTIDFNINRFLTTRLYLHMRYDTETPRIEGSSWRKFQFKEIFSFGFAYHFGVK